MSSFFDEASLVMIPSGYKNQKVYSVKPLDGSGDLTFSRASSATRVASNGLIEKVRKNVVLRSQEQSDAQYGAVINQITSRVAVANPLTGQNNAYKITSAGGSDPYIGQTVSGLSNGENTFSLWLWTDSGQNTAADLIFYNAAATEVYSTGLTITTTPTRYSFTVNFASVGASATVRLDLCQSCGVTYLYTYGWQAETGVMTDYIPTVTTAVSVGPVSGLPRLDYLNSTCPRLLLEPQRSNLALYSEQLNNAAWTKGQSGTGVAPVITANNAISPDGTQNADTVLFNSGAGTTASDFSTLFQIFGGTTATYTGSFYAKTPSGTAQIQVRIDGASYTVFTITNQWQRFTLTKALTGTSNVFEIVIRRGLNEPMNATATIQLWGVQVELGAYATSYIPTLGTSVTRVADAAYKTGISSLIGQTEGTLFVESELSHSSSFNEYLMQVSASSADRIFIYREGTTNKLGCFVRFGSTTIYTQLTAGAITGTVKAAFAYKSGSLAFYVNGTQVALGTATFSTPPSMGIFDLDSNAGLENGYFNYKQALLFKTRLTNAQLAELTTL